MIIRFISFVFSTVMLVSGVQAYIGKYPIHNFSPADYKAGIQNIAFAQNRDMNLFVANNLGVLSYNSHDWELHPFTQGKKERSLAFDESTNRLYVGSQGEIGFFEGDWNRISLTGIIPEGYRDFEEVWDVFVSQSRVFFCTFKGIYLYDGKEISVISHPEGFNRTFLVNGRLLTQNSHGELLEVVDNQLVKSFHQSIHNQIIAGVVSHKEGYLVFYNSGQIEFVNSFGAEKKFEILARELEGKYVNHVTQLSDTRLAISTQTSGLYFFDFQNEAFENISSRDGLQSNACLRTFQDYSGKLWVGLQNGLSNIDINSPLVFINQEINLQGSGYDAFETDEGIYFTTSNGIYFLPHHTSVSKILKGTEGPAYGIRQINENLYAGHHTGLFLLKEGKAKKIATTDGLWHVKQLRSNPEFAIAGSYSGLVLFRIFPNQELQLIGKIKGFNESSRFFEEDGEGRIWVGQFYKGLYRITLNESLTESTVEKVSDTYEDSLQEQIILSRIDNNMYLGTRNGIYSLDPSTGNVEKAPYFLAEIGQQQVFLLTQDRQKNIHVITGEQMGYYKQISNNNYVFVPSSPSKQRFSLNNDLLNLAINTRNGVLYNANEGFIQYIPEQENQVVPQTPLLVKSVSGIGKDIVFYSRNPFQSKQDQFEKLVIPISNKVIEFRVEYFQYHKSHQQLFRYYLQGFDEDFGEWSGSYFKEYTNLPAGDYELLVQTNNYLGQIITSSPVSIEIKPPFYATRTSKLIYALICILSIVFLLFYQNQRYKRKAIQAEEDNQQALIEKELQKEKALKQFEEEKIKSELQHTNSLLAASTMNLVVKNEFIETIKEKLVGVIAIGKNKEANLALKRIIKDIDKTLKIREDWAQFEYHFDQVHGDFLSRIREEFPELTPNEQKLCAFLRLNLNTKDISNIMGISLRSVEVSRYRLRKKIGLNNRENLTKYMLEY